MSARPGVRIGMVMAGLALAALSALPLLAQTAPPPAAATPAPAEVPAPAPAETVPPDAAASQADLDAVESSISLSRERSDALKKEIADMEGDRTKQNAALIAAAQRVKLAEIEVADVEERLSTLIVSELEVRGRLDGADSQIANVLA
ncbi:MAG TPA: hypothetical protein VL147_01925, partial [Devosia sp.]|nr:hypothetical protein [Devosia sp.]